MEQAFAYSVVLGAASATQSYFAYTNNNVLVANCGNYYDYFSLVPDSIRNVLGTSKDVVVTAPMTPFECNDLDNKVAIILSTALYEGLGFLAVIVLANR